MFITDSNDLTCLESGDGFLVVARAFGEVLGDPCWYMAIVAGYCECVEWGWPKDLLSVDDDYLS